MALLRPELRGLYTTVRDIATYAPIVTPLGFVPMPDAVQLDGVTYHSVLLDFGPSSVDGWLAKLAARELLITEDSILDPVERQLVPNGGEWTSRASSSNLLRIWRHGRDEFDARRARSSRRGAGCLCCRPALVPVAQLQRVTSETRVQT
jgi:hypothetical protein